MLISNIRTVADCDAVVRQYFRKVWETTGYGEVHRYYEREHLCLLITYFAEQSDLHAPISTLLLTAAASNREWTFAFSTMHDLHYHEETGSLEILFDMCTHQYLSMELTRLGDITARVRQHPRIATDECPAGR